MDITVYTVNGCHYCSQVKELLRRANLDFKKVKIGQDITREEFLDKYPNAIGYPFTVIDGVEYKSLVDTAKFLVENKLVSSKTQRSNKWDTPTKMYGSPFIQ